MNRFVKDNLILVISIGATCLVALGLLVYGIIEWVNISDLMSETDSLRDKIKNLNRVSPAPVDENKPLIQKDIDAYNKLLNELTPVFDSPFRKSKKAFLRVLYNLKETDNIDEAARKFLDLYNERVMSAPNPTAQRMQWDKLRGEFSNWKAAADAFREEAVKAGVDREHLENYINEVVLEQLGIPQRMNENPEELKRFLNDYRTYWRDRLGERFACSENFGMVAPANGFAKGDYPVIARQCMILSDIIGRVANSKVETFNGIVIRGANGESMNGTFSEENGCRISHYTFEVNGSLDSIRDLAARFDTALRDNRFYIVRSVFLYGPESETLKINSMLKPGAAEVAAENQPAEEQNTGLFGGGRRARLARARQQEAKQREQEIEKRNAASLEAMRQREKELPPHERHGYGDIQLGEVSSFKAVFDIDYIERI